MMSIYRTEKQTLGTYSYYHARECTPIYELMERAALKGILFHAVLCSAQLESKAFIRKSIIDYRINPLLSSCAEWSTALLI